jgi:DNA mismatch repair protein MutS
MASLYDEYESYVLKYKKEYGDNTVVLYQCGSFFEIYSSGDGEVRIKELSELLNIQLSRRNKAIIEVNRSNTLMAGFPDYTIEKYLNILVDNNYTVIIVSQISPPPKPVRAVTQIVSPGTRIINNDNNVDSNNLVSIYIEELKSSNNKILVGISLIDLSTGQSKCAEFASKNSQDINYPLDEVYRLLTIYNPKEVIIFGTTINLTFDYICSYLELDRKCVHDRLFIFNGDICNVFFQTQLLQKIFPKHGLLTPIEYIGLEMMPLALNSFTMLMQFSYAHDENIVKKIGLPEMIIENRNLNISYNALKQLNIDCLNKILNNTNTSIGKRYFKERLYNPLFNSKAITSSYQNIECLLIKDLYKEFIVHLVEIYDLERLFRKIRLNTIQPVEWTRIISSLKDVLKLFKLYMESNICFENISNIKSLNENTTLFYEECISTFEDNIIPSNNFFKTGKYEKIDALQEKLDDKIRFFKDLVDSLNSLNGPNSSNFFKLDNNERDGYFISVTQKRFDETKKANNTFIFKNTIDFKDIQAKPISTSSNIVRLQHKVFKNINAEIYDIKKDLDLSISNHYKTFVIDTGTNFDNIFNPCVDFIAQIDYTCCCCKNASVKKHCRPIIDDEKEKAFIDIKELRHPIVEDTQTLLEYVSNDLSLGYDSNDGILLYGVNSAGKSTLMKSCGIAVIMAQAGMYVSCSQMLYKPYKNIFTRIPSGDDILKGQSTFTVEVGELRNILKRADSNSLVIGDELCCGTESISALSIVSAGIIELCSRSSSFIFASHLHDLVNISRIKILDNLKIYHLGVLYDEKSGKLIYNRKLSLGQGNTLYGLEVCKSLSLGNEFISLANDIRRELLNVNDDILNAKPSSYNSKKYVDHECTICFQKSDEVHHIKEQHLADKNGFIGRHHKNALYNLVTVCKKCHDSIHHGNVRIDGYVQTSEGIELAISTEKSSVNAIPPKDNNSIILSYLKSGMSISEICRLTNTSRYKVSKILKSL